MRATVQRRYGPPSVVELVEVEMPSPRRGEVRVRVQAAGAHVGDWHVCTGEPYLLRAMGFGLRAPRPGTRGTQLAGVVDAVGPGSLGVAVGDAVFGFATATFAEFALARADRLAPLPTGLDVASAAVLPVSGTTALQALRVARRALGGAVAGRRVLVVGAGGAVGTFAVQLAVADDAVVDALCSEAKRSLVTRLGVREVFDYQRGEAPPAGAYDVVIDTAGSRPIPVLTGWLAERGVAVLVGGEGGGRWLGPVPRLLAASLRRQPGGRRVLGLMAGETRADLLELVGYVERGALRSVIGTRAPLDAVADVLRSLGEGHGRGQSVIEIAADA